MRLEVEQKHRVDDVAALVSKLEKRGVSIGPPVTQVDQYFAHPARDFATTDEALRIRTVGDKSFVTYKGPKLDTTTKTRRELELPLAESDADASRFRELLMALGFRPVATVRKQRRTFHVQHRAYKVEGALDACDDVGTFVELELQADDADIDDARATIASLAGELNLGNSERRSYLELLLNRRRTADAN
jgi:adenylate cyclase class 2